MQTYPEWYTPQLNAVHFYNFLKKIEVRGTDELSPRVDTILIVRASFVDVLLRE